MDSPEMPLIDCAEDYYDYSRALQRDPSRLDLLREPVNFRWLEPKPNEEFVTCFHSLIC
jgi:hypothetical protein